MTTQEKLAELIEKLNPIQSIIFPSILWLLNPRGGYASGRTYLIAVAVLELAVSNPGSLIPIFDHSRISKQTKASIKSLLVDVLDAASEFTFTENDELVYEPQEK